MSFRKIIESHDPNSIALIYGDNVCLTWGELSHLCRVIDDKLNFIKDGMVVQISANTNFKNILAFSCACYSGFSFETVEIVESSELQNKFSSLFLQAVTDIKKTKKIQSLYNKSSNFDRSNQRIILETSGTTGLKKKIIHGILALEYQAKAVTERLNLSVNDRQLAYMPLNYIYGMSVIFTWLNSGSSLAVSHHGVQSMSKFFDEILRAEITLFSGVPHTYLLMKRWGFEKLKSSKIRCLTQAGGYLPKPVKNKIQKDLPNINFFVMYGQTEFCGRISQGIYREETSDNFVGSLLDQIDAILDENDELYINSPSICRNADKIMKCLDRDGKLFYSTGDIAQVYGRDLFVSGRNQNFIKVGGRRISQKNIISLIEINEEINSVYIANGINRSEKVLIGIHIELSNYKKETSHELIPRLERSFKDALKKLLGNTGYKIYLLLGHLPILKSGKVDALQVSKILKDAFIEKKPVHIWL